MSNDKLLGVCAANPVITALESHPRLTHGEIQAALRIEYLSLDIASIFGRVIFY
ncbi:hypothetical protein [Nostoc sp.]|uniref:hypothetical protein n=1 Tax=Nostoc sp. TaxID=1180 RepID=UPI002FFAF30B